MTGNARRQMKEEGPVKVTERMRASIKGGIHTALPVIASRKNNNNKRIHYQRNRRINREQKREREEI